MIDRDSRHDRALPTFVTLVVAAFLLMTIDVRLAGGSVSSNIRSTRLERPRPAAESRRDRGRPGRRPG